MNDKYGLYVRIPAGLTAILIAADFLFGSTIKRGAHSHIDYLAVAATASVIVTCVALNVAYWGAKVRDENVRNLPADASLRARRWRPRSLAISGVTIVVLALLFVVGTALLFPSLSPNVVGDIGATAVMIGLLFVVQAIYGLRQR